jgi:hypothetical protein
MWPSMDPEMMFPAASSVAVPLPAKKTAGTPRRAASSGVRLIGTGPIDVPVDAQPFQGRALAAEFGLGVVDRADWPGAHR